MSTSKPTKPLTACAATRLFLREGQAVEKVYGLPEARPFIGLSLEQIRSHIKSGRIKAIRPGAEEVRGGRFYILESELERIQSTLVAPAKDKK